MNRDLLAHPRGAAGSAEVLLAAGTSALGLGATAWALLVLSVAGATDPLPALVAVAGAGVVAAAALRPRLSPHRTRPVSDLAG